MAKVMMAAIVPYKGRAAGETFETSVKNARALEAAGTAKLFSTPVSAPKKAPAKKAPAKKAAVKKAPTKRTYATRALKAE